MKMNSLMYQGFVPGSENTANQMLLLNLLLLCYLYKNFDDGVIELQTSKC